MTTLSNRLLGGLTVEIDGEECTANFSGRLRTLLALLLLHADHPQSRQAIAFTLWPESSEKQARTNLRKLLLLLRAALGSNAHHPLSSEQSLCWRNDDDCWLDTTLFEHTLALASQSNGDKAIALYAQAITLYRGDLLPDCYDEWILGPRESLRDHYINALARLCVLYEEQGRYAEAVATARRLLQQDP